MPTSIITRGSRVSIAGRRSRGLSPAFSRASAAYQSDGRKVGVGVPRFEAVGGRRGVLVEEGTTNVVPDSQMINAVSWTKEVFKGTITPDATAAPDGSFTADQIYITGGYVYRRVNLPAGRTYTFSCWVKSATGADIQQGGIHIWCYNGAKGSGRRAFTYAPITTEWRRLEVTYAAATDETNFSFLVAAAPFVAVPHDIYVWGAQIEDKAHSTSYVATSGGMDSRLPDLLTVPITASGAGAWTIDAWARTNIDAGFERVLFEAGDRFSVGLGADSRPTLTWTSAEGPQTASGAQTVANPTDWHHWAYSFDGVTSRVHVDGAKVIEASTEFAAAMPAEIVVATAEDRYWNGLVEDLVILLRGCSDSEIAAHMAGDIPNGCYHYLFDGDLWPAPGSLGAVVAPSVTTRPGRVDVVTRRGSVDIVTRPGKLEVIGR